MSDKKKTITVEALVNASIEKVWNQYNQAEHIVNWNFASDDWHCPKSEVDLQPGGKFTSTMAAKDGSFSFDFGGIYDVVIDQKHVAYTLEDGRKVTVDFTKEGEATRVVTRFDPENENPEELQQQGWQAVLNNFKLYSEAN